MRRKRCPSLQNEQPVPPLRVQVIGQPTLLLLHDNDVPFCHHASFFLLATSMTRTTLFCLPPVFFCIAVGVSFSTAILRQHLSMLEAVCNRQEAAQWRKNGKKNVLSYVNFSRRARKCVILALLSAQKCVKNWPFLAAKNVPLKDLPLIPHLFRCY